MARATGRQGLGVGCCVLLLDEIDHVVIGGKRWGSEVRMERLLETVNGIVTRPAEDREIAGTGWTAATSVDDVMALCLAVEQATTAALALEVAFGRSRTLGCYEVRHVLGCCEWSRDATNRCRPRQSGRTLHGCLL